MAGSTLIDGTVQPRQALQQRHAIRALGLVVAFLGRAVEDVLQKFGGFRNPILGFEDIDFVVTNLNGIGLGGLGFIARLAGLLEIPLLAIDLRHPQIGLGVRGIVRDQPVINRQRRRVILREH